MSTPESRRRWISLGELIALGALIISALGLWITWKSNDRPAEDKPTRVVEERTAIPLSLHAKADDDGQSLTISPIEQTHALDSASLTIEGAPPIDIGSDGKLDASSIESAIKSKDENKGAHSVPVRITARYVEAGKDRTGGGRYVLRYRWEGGGLFGGRSLRLVSLTRA